MRPAIVFAFRDMGVPERAAAFALVAKHFAMLGWPIVVEGLQGLEFGRATAINHGVQRAIHEHRADVILQVDPDSLITYHQAKAAMNRAKFRDGLVVAFERYLYTDQDTGRAILDGVRDWRSVGPDDCDSHGIGGVGNAVAFSVRTWDRADRFDERFGVWGGDDGAFDYACRAMVGPTLRVPGDMVHLWHPRLPQSEPGTPGYQEQWAILSEYIQASQVGPAAVADVIARRACS